MVPDGSSLGRLLTIGLLHASGYSGQMAGQEDSPISLPIRGWLVILALVTGCSPSPLASETGSPTPDSPHPSQTASPRATSTPAPEVTHLPFHGDRQVVVDTLTANGFDECSEFVLNDGRPAVLCTWPGAGAGEGFVVIGAPDDFLAVRVHSSDGAKVAEFLFMFGTDEITAWVLGELDSITQTGIVPTSSSERIADATVAFEADENLRIVVTIQAPNS